MALNKGKIFEAQFKQQFKQQFKNSFVFRLVDRMDGFQGSVNPCDFICFDGSRLYLLEIKSHLGASIPFENITQYDKLKDYTYVPNCLIGVILWLIDKDKIYFIPIDTLTQMKKDGKKSVGLKAVQEGYNIIEIPTVKKRVYLDADYTKLKEIEV